MPVALQRCGRSRLSKIVLVAALGSLAAGCSGQSMRLNTPLFAGSTPPAPQPGAATGGVQSGTLPPLSSASALQADPSILTTPPALRERGWSVEGAPIVEVGQGDTAATLSQGFGVPVSVILEANGLMGPEDIRPGQRLVMPTYVYRDNPGAAPTATDAIAAAAPVQTVPAIPTPALGAPAVSLNQQAGEGRHLVQTGDTLYSIARTHGVSVAELAALNGLPVDGNVRLGSTLRIPGAAGAAPAQAETQVARLEPQPTAGAVLSDVAPDPVIAAPQPAAPEAVATPAPDVGGPGFRWPVRGRIIAGFGKQADGARNDGINLSVPAGTPVQAAESGTVIYAGNELEGYGNLVLVQHGDDWVSAYAHADAVKVKRGDKVVRGQTIATVGTSGSVDQPQLHFELRKRSKPVDPLPHLAGA